MALDVYRKIELALAKNKDGAERARTADLLVANQSIT